MTLTEPDIDIMEKIVEDKVTYLKDVPSKLDKVLEIVTDLAGQFKGMQEEQTVQAKRLSDLEDRVANQEQSIS